VTTIDCRTCGEPFTPQRKTAKFCSDQCRYRWNTAGSERKRIPDSVRFTILERDGFRCRYCGAHPHRDELRVDHIIPVMLGGHLTSPQNLVTACTRCNSGKGDNLLRLPLPPATDEPVVGVYWNLQEFPEDTWFEVSRIKLEPVWDGLYNLLAER
jgi:endogenous inhibitor of DNA gyrase (YacG/DUF329 family)